MYILLIHDRLNTRLQNFCPFVDYVSEDICTWAKYLLSLNTESLLRKRIFKNILCVNESFFPIIICAR